jgi:hypothetical protein
MSDRAVPRIKNLQILKDGRARNEWIDKAVIEQCISWEVSSALVKDHVTFVDASPWTSTMHTRQHSQTKAHLGVRLHE